MGDEGSGSKRGVGFTSEFGLSVALEGDTMVGRGRAWPELCLPEAGVMRPSVLITWSDILTGSLANEFTLPRICLTVDLDVRVARPIPAGTELVATGRILKGGRTVQFGETTFTAADDDAVVAVSIGTFVASPREQDIGFSTATTLTSRALGAAPPPPGPVADLLQREVVGDGVVEAVRHERILNWAETVQGGAVAVLAEEAVLALSDAPVPVELSVRYLASVRYGPMRATARRIGEWVRVEVVDRGNDDRLAAVAVARA